MLENQTAVATQAERSLGYWILVASIQYVIGYVLARILVELFPVLYMVLRIYPQSLGAFAPLNLYLLVALSLIAGGYGLALLGLQKRTRGFAFLLVSVLVPLGIFWLHVLIAFTALLLKEFF